MITSRSARQLSAVEKKDKAQPKVPVAKRFMEGDPSLEPEPRQRRRPQSKGRPRAPRGEADTVVTQALQPKKKAGGRALRPRKTASRAGARGADGDEAPRGRSRKGPKKPARSHAALGGDKTEAEQKLEIQQEQKVIMARIASTVAAIDREQEDKDSGVVDMSHAAIFEQAMETETCLRQTERAQGEFNRLLTIASEAVDNDKVTATEHYVNVATAQASETSEWFANYESPRPDEEEPAEEVEEDEADARFGAVAADDRERRKTKRKTAASTRRGSSLRSSAKKSAEEELWEARPVEPPPPNAREVYVQSKRAITVARERLLASAGKAKEELAAQTYTKDLKRRLVDATEKCFKQERALKNAKHAAVWKPTTRTRPPPPRPTPRRRRPPRAAA